MSGGIDRNMQLEDIIMLQRIWGGWEYRYTSNGDIHRAFDHDTAMVKAKLLRQLGWDRWRLDRVAYRRF